MAEITQADWDRLTAAYGQQAGQLLVWMRIAGEREAELADVRARLAALLDQCPVPAEMEG